MNRMKWWRENAFALVAQFLMVIPAAWAVVVTFMWLSERGARQHYQEAYYRQAIQGEAGLRGNAIYTLTQYGSSSSTWDSHFVSDMKSSLEPVSNALEDISDELGEVNDALDEITRKLDK